MDKKVLAIVPQEFVPGFEMAGASCAWPTDQTGPEQLLIEAMKSDQWGLVLVHDGFQKDLSQKIRDQAFESVSPVVMFIRLFLSEGQPIEEQISEMVRQAIGYSLKIRED